MADREEIAKRHGIPGQADKLVGETAEQLEADAVARAALAQMVTPVEMDAEPEPEPVKGLAPRSKPVSEYSDEEREAQARHTLALRQREREEKEQRERERVESERSDEQRFGDAASAALTPDAKRAARLAIVEGIHPGEGEDQV